MAIVRLPTLDSYANADWELVLMANGSELNVDIISANFTINNGDINNPFNLNCTNTGSFRTTNDVFLKKGLPIVAKGYLLDSAGARTETFVDLGNYIISEGSFDEYENSYNLVSAEDRLNVNCPYINFNDPAIVSQESKSMNFAELVNLEFRTAGFDEPIDSMYELDDIIISVNPNYIDYTQFTLITLLNMYNALHCNTIEGLDPTLDYKESLPYDLASGSPTNSYVDASGVNFIKVNYNFVDFKTETVEADESSGIKEHTISTRGLTSHSYYFGLNSSGEQPQTGNGFTIDFPFPLGSDNVSAETNKNSITKIMSCGNIMPFLMTFDSVYFPTASIDYIGSPEVINRLNQNIAFYDTSAIDSDTLADYLVDGNYEFDLSNPTDLSVYNQITHPFNLMFMQFDITFNGSMSITISSGNTWEVSNFTDHTGEIEETTAINTIAADTEETSGSMVSRIQEIEEYLTWLKENGITVENFADMLANADYLTPDSPINQEQDYEAAMDEVYTDLEAEPTLDNYPCNLWKSNLLYPSSTTYPSDTTYPGGDYGDFASHVGAKAYMTKGGVTRGWIFCVDENGTYYWREITDGFDTEIIDAMNQVEDCPTREEVKEELENYAQKTDLDLYALKTDLDAYTPTTELEINYATKLELQNYTTTADLVRDYATKLDLDYYFLNSNIVKVHNEITVTTTIVNDWNDTNLNFSPPANSIWFIKVGGTAILGVKITDVTLGNNYEMQVYDESAMRITLSGFQDEAREYDILVKEDDTVGTLTVTAYYIQL